MLFRFVTAWMEANLSSCFYAWCITQILKYFLVLSVLLLTLPFPRFVLFECEYLDWHERMETTRGIFFLPSQINKQLSRYYMSSFLLIVRTSWNSYLHPKWTALSIHNKASLLTGTFSLLNKVDLSYYFSAGLIIIFCNLLSHS